MQLLLKSNVKVHLLQENLWLEGNRQPQHILHQWQAENSGIQVHTSVGEHVDYLWELSKHGTKLIDDLTDQSSSETCNQILAAISQLIIRAISIHIMLSDTEKWGLPDPETVPTLKRSKQNPSIIAKTRCLEEIKEALRELCFSLYNYSICSNAESKATDKLPGWALIRRESAIQASIKHHMAVLGNLKSFQWTPTDKPNVPATPKSKFERSDLTDAIEFLKMKLAQLKVVFGDYNGALPSINNNYEGLQ